MSLPTNEKKLDVLLVSTSYPQNKIDWQGRFIADMVQALAENDLLNLCVWAPSGNLPANVQSNLSPSDKAWLAKLLAEGGIAHVLRTKGIKGIFFAFTLLRLLRHAYRQKIPLDVAHVNWLQNALPLWGTSTPAVITVLGSDFGLLKLPGMKLMLRSMIKQRKCIIAPNADWMVPALNNAFGDLAEIRAIPFGVEKCWFDLIRTRPTEQPAKWLVVTRITKNKLGDLISWGKNYFDNQRELHLLGPMQEPLDLPEWIHYHGATNPDALLRDWFPQVTGLITLSQHDEGRPQVLLEAMASGLPVIVSNIPAHRDLVHDRETGWICDSPENFLQALNFLENSGNNLRVGSAAKIWITKEIGTWQDCADRYEKAYRDILRST
jgi:glycosyltransferase involved in cell wall biosynthesis